MLIKGIPLRFVHKYNKPCVILIIIILQNYAPVNVNSHPPPNREGVGILT
jgi:hypothetical protein